MGIFQASLSHYNPATEIPSLTGKVILVTGGNAGLGKQSVLQFAKHSPAHIWMGARSLSKAQAAIDEIRKEVPSANITALQLDLTSFASIRAAAATVVSQSDRLDILMLNAGIMATPPGLTTEGYEIQFGTNHVGHALLTKLLRPLLLKTTTLPNADVRVVVLSSAGHNIPLRGPSGPIDYATIKTEQAEHYSALRYGQSKLANVYFAQQMAKHYPQILTVAAHPGTVRTDLAVALEKKNVLWWLVVKLLELQAYPVEDGAKSQLWAATALKERIENGRYYVPVGKGGNESPVAKDEAKSAKLWEWTEAELEGERI
ncbi:hypothetical protein B0T17DRAFT_593960 [Bombardia bombarda]|uniref:NAD(P)-binding protein n=1 Tax=Bombardia bombarda TaxID=252184 RepID=A0AA39W9R9_9PEZI|nr:hypothetical protein B0T17DRAFT_593960 [Bombardia bombarda]